MRKGGESMLYWYIAIVPIMVGLCSLYLIMCNHSLGKQGLIAKCGATWLCLCTSAMYVLENNQNPWMNYCIWGIFFYMLADGALEVSIPFGGGLFAVGHILVIRGFLEKEPPTALTITIWLILIVLATTVYYKEIRETIKKGYAVMLLYPIILAYMCATACSLGITRYCEYWEVALGGILFVFSDLLIFIRYRRRDAKIPHGWVMVLYYIGVVLIGCVNKG